MKILRIILLSLMLGLLPALAFSATYEVTVNENGFNPSNLNILKGDTVTWVNRGSIPYRVATLAFIGNAYLDSGLIAPDSRFSHTFALPGVIYYYDRSSALHAGTITAEGVTISPTSSVLLITQKLDLVILEEVIQAESKIRITLDGKVVYDSSELLTMPKTSTQELEINTTEEPRARYIKIPIALNTYYPGTHTLTVEIYGPTGRVLRDSAVYELITPISYLFR